MCRNTKTFYNTFNFSSKSVPQLTSGKNTKLNNELKIIYFVFGTHGLWKLKTTAPSARYIILIIAYSESEKGKEKHQVAGLSEALALICGEKLCKSCHSFKVFVLG